MTDDKVLDELKQQFISRDKTERENFFLRLLRLGNSLTASCFFSNLPKTDTAFTATGNLTGCARIWKLVWEKNCILS